MVSCHEWEVHPSHLWNLMTEIGLDCCLPQTVPIRGKTFRRRGGHLPNAWHIMSTQQYFGNLMYVPCVAISGVGSLGELQGWDWKDG